MDLILALDVLEHVDDLPKVLQDMARLLKPQGLLLVSGPTENWMYRLGRSIGQRFAGPEFSGHYHHRNIYDVQGELAKLFTVKIVRRLVYPLTFFVLLGAEPVRQKCPPGSRGANSAGSDSGGNRLDPGKTDFAGPQS